MTDDLDRFDAMAALNAAIGEPPPEPPYSPPLVPGHMGTPDRLTCEAAAELLAISLVISPMHVRAVVNKLPVAPRPLLRWWLKKMREDHHA